MRKEMFELNIGERFKSNGAVFVCIRMYGEYDNVLAIDEDSKRMVKFPPYAACEFLPTQVVEPVEAGALDVNDVVRMVDDKNNFNSETFLILRKWRGVFLRSSCQSSGNWRHYFHQPICNG
ncbi:hypothetical protein [Salmonella phage 7-11]|uniref:Uncharacterized protein n=1 Tax=Salmonella phage 7-11 TaxID=1054968 RepID=G0X578_9CAUD|nr:hypothetical protein SaPh711_gp145 [Salmonella phage 7-11]AEK82060.1 hypothetical protein [Salmonella phage 7-11]